VDYRSVMPTNLYGPGDSYHPENSHVIPALIRRFHEAKVAKAPTRSHQKRTDFGGVQIVKVGTTVSALQPAIHPKKAGNTRHNTKGKVIISAKSRSNKNKVSTSSKIPNDKAIKVSQEDIDFDQEYVSAQERNHVNNWKRQTKALVFQPATFQLDKPPLSTEQLVNVTADLVADGFKDLGSQVYTPLNVILPSRSDAYTTTKGAHPTQSHEKEKKKRGQNYFGLLQSDDEDENPIPLLQFAPPTFQFQSTRPDDVDPDL
jgi:hypothetical protein